MVAEAGQRDMYESEARTGCGVRAVSHLGNHTYDSCVSDCTSGMLATYQPDSNAAVSKLLEVWAATGLHSRVMERADRAPGLGLQLVLGERPCRRSEAEPCETN